MKFVLFTICFSLTFPLQANQTQLMATVAKAFKKIRTEAVQATRKGRQANSIPRSHIGLLTPKVSSVGIRKLANDQVQHVVSELADIIHGSWQKTARLEGRVDRYKPMKIDGQTITKQDELNKYLDANNIPQEYRSRFRIQDDGKGNMVAHEDILNIPNRHLAPNNQEENLLSAYVAISYLDSWIAHGGKIDQQFMHAASDFVHEQWKLRNQWKKDSNPELFKSFDELPTTEAKKDVDIVNDALQIYKNRLTTQDAERLKRAGQRLKATETSR